MNPAALMTNLADLVPGGILIVNRDAFDESDLAKAGYVTNPLEDGSLDGYQLFPVEMTRLTRLAVEGLGLSQKEADRCRNFYAMGLTFWLYDRSLEPTERYITEKFGKKPGVAEANRRACTPASTMAKQPTPWSATFRSTRPICRRAPIATSPATRRWPGA